jgi:Ran-binding protein 1
VFLLVVFFSFPNTVMSIGARKFKDVFEAAQEDVSGKTGEKNEEADETADLLDKLKVESKSEEAAAPEETKTEAKEAAESKTE